MILLQFDARNAIRMLLIFFMLATSCLSYQSAVENGSILDENSGCKFVGETHVFVLCTKLDHAGEIMDKYISVSEKQMCPVYSS